MAYTEVTNTSWGSRIKNALGGILIGIILFIVAFPLLWWNEGNSVKTYKMLKEVLGKVTAVASDPVDSANEGKLVHVSGQTHTDDMLEDPQFGISETAIHLGRKAEIYQWKQDSHKTEKKKMGGGTKTETEYTYKKVWSSSPVNSEEFKDPEYRGKNKGTIPYPSTTRSARNVGLDAYKLNSTLIGSIQNSERYDADSANLSEEMKSKVNTYNGGFYFGANSGSPEIGDVRVTFSIVRPSNASVIGKQIGDTFEPYLSKAGKSFQMLKVGIHSADIMIAHKQRENKIFTWVFRLVGFLLMFFGLSLIFKPLSVLADVVPLIGNIVGFGTGFMAGCIAFVLSFITMGIAWIFYRPILGIALIAIPVVITILLIMKRKKKVVSA